MKLSPTQADVLRRLGRGHRLKWSRSGPFWAGMQPLGPPPTAADLASLRNRGMIETAAFGTSRVVTLSGAGREWLAKHPEDAG